MDAKAVRKAVSSLGLPVLLLALFSCAGVETAGTAEDEFNRGLSLFNRGRFEESVGAFERATELKPEYGEAYLYIGRSYLSLGRYPEALPPLRAAYRLAPEKTKKEAAELILDIIVRHATEFDPGLRQEYQELLGR
jgi:tetratricopeptide (TPR) repeat protein